MYLFVFGHAGSCCCAGVSLLVAGGAAVQAFLCSWLVCLLSHRGAWAFHCDAFSCCRVQALGHRLSSCDTQV